MKEAFYWAKTQTSRSKQEETWDLLKIVVFGAWEAQKAENLRNVISQLILDFSDHFFCSNVCKFSWFYDGNVYFDTSFKKVDVKSDFGLKTPLFSSH